MESEGKDCETLPASLPALALALGEPHSSSFQLHRTFYHTDPFLLSQTPGLWPRKYEEQRQPQGSGSERRFNIKQCYPSLTLSNTFYVDVISLEHGQQQLQ